MSFESLIAVAAGLQAMGVFAIVGKAWAWMMRVEKRLIRIEARLDMRESQ